ncbi:MAG: hypothetical protein EWM47_11505 [Anaerolineaceae bacterium]|nr:MAG: hypothetical protein EWM47_11505 [Anaerolineaceae bacterium]
MNEHMIRNLFEPLPEIDFNKGYHYYLCNIDNYSKALLSTLKSIRSKLPILKTMAETSEYEGLRMITQTLRRMMSTIGGETIVDLAYELEKAHLNDDDLFEDKLFEFMFTLEDLASRMEELVKKLGFSHMKGSQDNKQDSYFNYDFTRTKESIRLSADFLDKKII